MKHHKNTARQWYQHVSWSWQQYSPVMLYANAGSEAGRRGGCSAAASPGSRQVSECRPAGTDACSGPVKEHEQWTPTFVAVIQQCCKTLNMRVDLPEQNKRYNPEEPNILAGYRKRVYKCVLNSNKVQKNDLCKIEHLIATPPAVPIMYCIFYAH